MNIQILEQRDNKFALIRSNGIVLNNADDALDILGNSDYQGASRIIIHEENINPAFFDLKTRIAGEILQKFSTYRKHLAIVGNFSKFKSKSLQDFIRESNRTGRIYFTETVEQAIEKLNRR